MFDELRGRDLLDGMRGRPGVDRDGSRGSCGLSQWIARAPWLMELDINPIIASGSKLMAVDARLRIASPPDQVSTMKRLLIVGGVAAGTRPPLRRDGESRTRHHRDSG